MLEDVDMINPAIISKIVPILRGEWIYVSENNESVMRHPGMRVFMTARSENISGSIRGRGIMVNLSSE